jgi:His/Glu/Gln/Arg/opine family amino acid ABC transporter permease subunit
MARAKPRRSPMPEVILANLPFLLAGLAVTLELTGLAIAGGTLLGLAIAIVRYLDLPVMSPIAAIYVGFIRGTPLLVVLLMTYFALPALLGYTTTAFAAALLGFILFSGAYLAEDIRAGLASVRRELIEAALATGLTKAKVLRLVILPQGLRRAMPSLFNQYVRLLKFTSVASVIGVDELTGGALLVNARVFQPVTIILSVAATYFVLCSGLSLVGRLLFANLEVRT